VAISLAVWRALAIPGLPMVYRFDIYLRTGACSGSAQDGAIGFVRIITERLALNAPSISAMNQESTAPPPAGSSQAGHHPPSIHVARARLDARIGQALSHAALWIAGPRGSGKTTAVAQYVAAHDLPCVTFVADPRQHRLDDVMRRLHQSLCAAFPGPMKAEGRLAQCLASRPSRELLRGVARCDATRRSPRA
jgi:hypothetical protein